MIKFKKPLGVFAVVLSLHAPACAPLFESQTSSFNTVNDVNSNSSIRFIPLNAVSVNYYSIIALDEYEYLTFKSDRKSVDEFSLKVLGFVPDDTTREFSRVGEITMEWWPKSQLIGSRSGLQNQDGRGFREVLVKDYPDFSEVWVFYSQFRH